MIFSFINEGRKLQSNGFVFKKRTKNNSMIQTFCSLVSTYYHIAPTFQTRSISSVSELVQIKTNRLQFSVTPKKEMCISVDHPIGSWPRSSILIVDHTETHLLSCTWKRDAHQEICVLCRYNGCNWCRRRRGR